MPRLVQMREKYGKDGFEVIAVATEQAKDEKGLASGRKFIAEKLKAPFPTVHVDGTTFYDAKISEDGVPAAFIFNRENKWVARMTDVDYDKIEATVADLVKKGDK